MSDPQVDRLSLTGIIPAGRLERLQDHLDRMRAGEPVIPLLPGQAAAQAQRLRAAGLPYPGIAIVMARYHGIVKTPSTWQKKLRALGAPPKHNSNGRRVAPWQR